MDFKEIGFKGVDWIHMAQDVSGGLLWTRKWTFGFNKRQVIWIAERLLDSQEGLRFMELVN
jgi:hypothetical protein